MLALQPWQRLDSPMIISLSEQSVGLSEVNTAVNQMDQVTQQNAAMVEEANAAGATLANEASRLRGLIGQFQLGALAADRSVSENRTNAATKAVSRSAPVASPPRRMLGKIAATFSANRSAAVAVDNERWEDF